MLGVRLILSFCHVNQFQKNIWKYSQASRKRRRFQVKKSPTIEENAVWRLRSIIIQCFKKIFLIGEILFCYRKDEKLENYSSRQLMENSRLNNGSASFVKKNG